MQYLEYTYTKKKKKKIITLQFKFNGISYITIC